MSRSSSELSSSGCSGGRRSKRRKAYDRDRRGTRHRAASGNRSDRKRRSKGAVRTHAAVALPEAPPGSWAPHMVTNSPVWHYPVGAAIPARPPPPGAGLPPTWMAPLPYPPARGKHPVGYFPDFADERPDAYRAFEQAAVRSTGSGVEIGLPGGLCLDKHVPDLLACLPCWLRRNIGDPLQRPWRLQSFDLSGNALADESVVQLLGSLRLGGVRVQRLLLAGNRIRAAGVHAVTEYVWDSPEAMHEIDLSGNEISVATDLNGDDPVSALLRCLYNHSAYPRRMPRSSWVTGQREAFDLEPLVLRIGGNFLKDPVRLLGLVCEKGGLERVRLRPGPEVYHPCRDEFLSLCLPDLARQRKNGEARWDALACRTATTSITGLEECISPDLDDLEERAMQQAVAEKLSEVGGSLAFPEDNAGAARWTLAGLVLALLSSKRTSGSIASELEAVIGVGHVQPLLEWTAAYLRTLRC